MTKPASKVLWLYGPAGAGKSAIAQTLCEALKASEALAASFFFTRGNDRSGTIRYFICTIAYQLSFLGPVIREAIGTAAAEDPSIFQQSTDSQLEKLIIQPFKSMIQKLPLSLPSQKYLVIVDGLDECLGDKAQCTILKHISDLIDKHELPLTFVVASRPEPHIYSSFQNDSDLSAMSDKLYLEPSTGDIRVFLADGCRNLRQNHDTMSSVPGQWPSKADMEQLIQRSSGYFIYTSTVLKFLEDPDRHPSQQLVLVLSGEPAPFTELDQLYHQILSTTPDHSLLVRILGYILVPRKQLTLSMIGGLLGLSTGSVHLALRRLAPVLQISGDHKAIHVIHASFAEYLLNRRRGGEFHVDTQKMILDLQCDCQRYLDSWQGIYPNLAWHYLECFTDADRPLQKWSRTVSLVYSILYLHLKGISNEKLENGEAFLNKRICKAEGKSVAKLVIM